MPSRALMQRAGSGAAAEITSRYPELLSRGVLVLAGPGNNGGDGWVIARALADAGASVKVVAPEGARSRDCIAERDLAIARVGQTSAYSGEGIVVDALLGTGSKGPARGPIAEARSLIGAARKHGAVVVAVDLPSGLDATTGAANAAEAADLTITFGTAKRGHFIARALCGTIVVIDIGLIDDAPASEPRLVDGDWVHSMIPPIAPDAHKGTRKKILFHGGAEGMSGAIVLGLEAALRSGAGMVKALVDSPSTDAVRNAVPSALVDKWPADDDHAVDTWADVLVIGPGLGRGASAKRAVISALARHKGAVLLDADALNVFENDERGLSALLANHRAMITPHPLECARLLGLSGQDVLDQRYDIGAELARELNAVVLLKGTPTVISAPDGRRFVVAAGTPSLATGGSGDVLCGIAGTLLAQMDDACVAAACAAWIHGRAAELAGSNARGTTLEDVLEMVPNAWRIPGHQPRYPVIAELPAITAR